jgi:signal transduction histidine kinase
MLKFIKKLTVTIKAQKLSIVIGLSGWILLFSYLIYAYSTFDGISGFATHLTKRDPMLIAFQGMILVAPALSTTLAYFVGRKIILEEELKKYAQRLESTVVKQTKELEESQAALVQAGKMACIGTLVSAVAHEINNPLGVILTYSQLLKSKAEKGKVDVNKVAEYAAKIEEVAKHCKATIQNLLDFSRQSKGDLRAVAVDEVIEASIALLHYKLSSRGVEVLRDVEDCTVVADRNQLMQVIVNLLDNAIDASREGSVINIAAMRDGDHVKITVADSGVGIPKEDLERIFEPFYTTKPPSRGTGLGLYLCDRIIKGLGGQIDVESEVGRGTAFIIKLPRGGKT